MVHAVKVCVLCTVQLWVLCTAVLSTIEVWVIFTILLLLHLHECVHISTHCLFLSIKLQK